ncbi:hypothetical protein KXX01_002399 [Aspergillus fumigatus]|nr:hypothetical protein KXX01_002399 [Aspergillus fumigatus]
MATQVSLFSYLQAAPPVIPASPPSNPSRNTTNTAYGADDIRSTAVWPGFDLQTILQRYEALLMQVQLPADPMPISPSRGVPTETALREKLGAEYRQALSQVNFYMKQHRSRYGFILTDRELVVFRRRDNNGNLELASPTPFTAGGTAQQPQLTVLMALWYLGMLAAQDQGVDRWYL